MALPGLVLHADLEPGSILQYLAVIAQVDIEAINFRHPKMPYGLRGFQDRVLRRHFPTVWAASDNFNNLIRAHWLLLGEVT